MTDLIIFGAGMRAKTLYEWASMARYTVLFFVDNDPNKWGTTINGVEVSPVQRLASYQCRVLVSEKHRQEMIRQLEEQSYKGSVVSLNDIIRELVVQEKCTSHIPTQQVSYVLDSYFMHSTWGGVESWSCFVGNALKARNQAVMLICGDNSRFDQEFDRCVHFKGGHEAETVKSMIDELQKRLPCVVITHMSIAMYAALIVQNGSPDQIRIVAVVHGSDPQAYQFNRIAYWADRLNAVVCISKQIESTLRESYGISPKKLLYRMNPIPLPETVVRKRSGAALKIGFAARLHRLFKRAELLPLVMDLCFGKGLDVEFNIAGEGDCSDLLKEYVASRHLEDKVHLLGWLPPCEMAAFWMEQDIYLNLSTSEGMSLAMLEAMACGAVPVVTDVSGVRDLIEDGKNGAIVSVDHWEDVAVKIDSMCQDRERLEKASQYNIGLIRENCNVEQYAEWVEKTFNLNGHD